MLQILQVDKRNRARSAKAIAGIAKEQ